MVLVVDAEVDVKGCLQGVVIGGLWNSLVGGWAGIEREWGDVEVEVVMGSVLV